VQLWQSDNSSVTDGYHQLKAGEQDDSACGWFQKEDGSQHCHDYNDRGFICEVFPNCTWGFSEGKLA